MIERINAPGLSDPPGYSHAVVASGGRLVTTAGAVPLDAEGNLVGRGDYAAQTLQVLHNLGLALAAAGTSGGNVLKTTVYVVTEVRSDLPPRPPTLETRGTPLGYEGQLVEVETIAVTA